MTTCDLVIPCRDEGPALPALLSRVPAGFEVIVVDNGSRDDTAEVARRLGARVVHEPTPGYGAAVHAGLLAATDDFVAFMDGDGSLDPVELRPLLADVAQGRADIALGRRRPVRPGVWPWHARAGNVLVSAWLRRRLRLPTHDIAPMRVCRRQALLDLDLRDRRFGYPVELLQAVARAGWRVSEHPVSYHPRAEGTRSKVSGSVVGTARTVRDFWKVLVMTTYAAWAVLVVAKAPVPGRVKTRLGADIGLDAAAELAAAALLDTIAAVSESGAAGHLCLAGDLAEAVRREEVRRALDGWTVTAQHGRDLADRLVHAHAAAGPGVVVQVGMDTPQLTATNLRAAADALEQHDAVLGPAVDGGWWALARRDPSVAEALRSVPMSTSSTCADTHRALTRAGHRVARTGVLRDVDTLEDARAVAEQAGDTLFARTWRALRESAS